MAELGTRLLVATRREKVTLREGSKFSFAPSWNRLPAASRSRARFHGIYLFPVFSCQRVGGFSRTISTIYFLRRIASVTCSCHEKDPRARFAEKAESLSDSPRTKTG